MRRLIDCDKFAAAGSKARTLAQLFRLGFLVPDGFVVLPGESVESATLQKELSQLGGEYFSVRSSASIEDENGAAAGVFVSRIRVTPSQVAAAIAEVRASLYAEGARAYLGWRKITPHSVTMAVLVHRFVEAERLGVAVSAGDHFVVEERAPTEPEWGQTSSQQLSRTSDDRRVAIFAAVEKKLGPVQIEFAITNAEIVLLQARPAIVTRSVQTQILEGNWQLDLAHNPAPLSQAQQSLVELVDSTGVGPRQTVFGGYLYFDPDHSLHAERSRSTLQSEFENLIAPACREALSRVVDLPSALRAYCEVYRQLVGTVTPALAWLREELDRFLQTHVGEGLVQQGDLLAGLHTVTLERDQCLFEIGRAESPQRELLEQRYLGQFGAYAPSWDVATPCDDETPERVRAQAAAWAASAESPLQKCAAAKRRAETAAQYMYDRLNPSDRSRLKQLLEIARATLPIAEADDHLFFEAQRTVRRALLQIGRALVGERRLMTMEQVFDLPIAQLSDGATDLQAEADRHRRAGEAAFGSRPPLRFESGTPVSERRREAGVFCGHATFGAVSGRAFVVDKLPPSSLPPGAILVVPALLPSLAPLLASARALVTEVGGVTSHGATLAREYRIPAVLGIGRAEIYDGDELFVDGARGRVYRVAVASIGDAGTSRGSIDRL